MDKRNHRNAPHSRVISPNLEADLNSAGGISRGDLGDFLGPGTFEAAALFAINILFVVQVGSVDMMTDEVPAGEGRRQRRHGQ